MERAGVRIAEGSKTIVCRRSLAGVAGSNPSRGMDVCVVSKTKKAKCGTTKTKTHAQTKCRVQQNTSMDVFVVFRQRETAKCKTIMTKNLVRMKHKQSKKILVGV